jgi:hypothetical protein
MRGWVCSLELLLVLASAVILRSESRETHDYILLSTALYPQDHGDPRAKVRLEEYLQTRIAVGDVHRQEASPEAGARNCIEGEKMKREGMKGRSGAGSVAGGTGGDIERI